MPPYDLPRATFGAVNSTAPRRRTVNDFLSLVRFQHTLFALPFAYVGMLLAADGWPGWSDFLWITVAMAGARTAAMAINRAVDAEIDARNPRTMQREIPARRLTRVDAYLLAALGFAALIAAGAALNPLTLALLPVAVFFLVGYSFTKRFTWWCHAWLGLTIGAAAAGGWIAVTGSFAWPAVVLWMGLGLWIAGFDVIYALLDLEFDRRHGVHSVPARFGRQVATTIARACHLGAFAAFAGLAAWPGLGVPYAVSLVGVAAVLVIQHVMLRSSDTAAVLRSFNANLWLSSILLAGVAFDVWWG